MKKLLFVLLILGLIAILAIFTLRNRDVTQETGETVVEKVVKTNGVVVAKTDVTKSGGSKLPQGFPTDIPVESVNVTDSYKAFYEKVSVTQYTVSYTSSKSREDLWTLYSDFMNGSEYRVDPSSSKSLGQISGTKGDDSLSVIVTSHRDISLVQLSFLDR